jgi:hypothetical protein
MHEYFPAVKNPALDYPFTQRYTSYLAGAPYVLSYRDIFDAIAREARDRERKAMERHRAELLRIEQSRARMLATATYPGILQAIFDEWDWRALPAKRAEDV